MGVLKRRRRVKTPGGLKSWTEILPKEFQGDPQVVVVSVKHNAMTRVATTADGLKIGVLETKRGPVGLQILNGGGGYLAQQQVIESHNIQMADPSYIGPLSGMPDRLLLDDRWPLIFLRDKAGQPFLNLKGYVWHVSESDDGRVN